MAEDCNPWDRLVPLEQGEPSRQPGILKGQLMLPEQSDLLAPLPLEELEQITLDPALAPFPCQTLW